MLRVYDVGGKLLNLITSMLIVSLCKSKRRESECSRIDSGVIQSLYHVPPGFHYLQYTNAVMKEGRIGVRFLEEGRD